MLACRTLGAIISFIIFFSFDLHVGKIYICSLLLLPEGWVGEGGTSIYMLYAAVQGGVSSNFSSIRLG